MVEKPLAVFRVTVFVPTLVSRGLKFDVYAPEQTPPQFGTLYVTSTDLHRMFAQCKDWPAEARVITERVSMGVSEPDGQARVDGKFHEACHGVKLVFELESPGVPPPRAWPHRWAVKSLERLDR